MAHPVSFSIEGKFSEITAMPDEERKRVRYPQKIRKEFQHGNNK